MRMKPKEYGTIRRLDIVQWQQFQNIQLFRTLLSGKIRCHFMDVIAFCSSKVSSLRLMQRLLDLTLKEIKEPDLQQNYDDAW
jgi:hypothetical protein